MTASSYKLGGRRREPDIGNMIRVVSSVRGSRRGRRWRGEGCQGGGGGAGGMYDIVGDVTIWNKESFLSSMLWGQSGQSSNGGGGGGGDCLRSDSIGCGAEASITITPPPQTSCLYFPPHYHVRRDNLRPSAM